MNLVLGYLILVGITSFQPVITTNTVAKFAENAASQASGLMKGDVIQKVNGRSVWVENDIAYELMKDEDGKVEMEVLRNGKAVLLPEVSFDFSGEGEGRSLVIDFKVKGEEKTLGGVLGYSFKKAASIGRLVWISLLDMVTGHASLIDYRLALKSVEAGVDKIRLNPGNIGDADRVKAVAIACANKGVPIRIGVNGGSLEKHILAKYGAPTADALVESGLYNARLLERFDFNQIVISLKSSNVATMVEAYRKLAERCDYPLHLGVTEAGTERMGLIKSAMGIGSLLLDGIGDTIRVSLTADPVREIAAAQDILRGLDLEKGVPQIVSCPTCGRTRIDLISHCLPLIVRLAAATRVR